MSLKNRPFHFYERLPFFKTYSRIEICLPESCGTYGTRAGEGHILDMPDRTRSSQDNETTHQWHRSLDRRRVRPPGTALRA